MQVAIVDALEACLGRETHSGGQLAQNILNGRSFPALLRSITILASVFLDIFLPLLLRI